MEEKTFIGMRSNVVFGLTWILFPFGIVALAVDHAKMAKNDKQQIVSAFVFEGILSIFAIIMSIIDSIVVAASNGNIWWISLLGLPVYIVAFIFWLIAMIKAFKGEDYHCPIAWGLAGAFIKDGAQDSASANVEETKTDAEEEKPEE